MWGFLTGFTRNARLGVEIEEMASGLVTGSCGFYRAAFCRAAEADSAKWELL